MTYRAFLFKKDYLMSLLNSTLYPSIMKKKVELKKLKVASFKTSEANRSIVGGYYSKDCLTITWCQTNCCTTNK